MDVFSLLWAPPVFFFSLAFKLAPTRQWRGGARVHRALFVHGLGPLLIKVAPWPTALVPPAERAVSEVEPTMTISVGGLRRPPALSSE